MYLPRSLISHLYLHLLRTHHPLSPPVLILVSLEPDALCACRILTSLFKRDYISHKIQPVSGYGDLAKAGQDLIRPMKTTEGGSGGIVVCLGVGGLVDLGELLGLENENGEQSETGGIEVWVIDARRPWNLGNVFGSPQEQPSLRDIDMNSRRKQLGVERGRILPSYRPGHGGIIVFDDGDIEEGLGKEKDSYCALLDIPDVDDDGEESDDSESENDYPSLVLGQSRKRKSWSDRNEDEESDLENQRPQRRVRSNSGSSMPSSPRPRTLLIAGSRSVSPDSRSPSPAVVPKEPSARTLRRRLLRLKRKHESVLRAYYSLGASYSEPVASLVYSLASEIGREDNDLLWYAIVGVSSLELYGRGDAGVSVSSSSEQGGSAGWGGERNERIRQLLRDEVRRLNPPDTNDIHTGDYDRGDATGVIPTTAKSPTDNSIRLSPEPRFLLVRHWSLYDSMLHSPYLSARLHIWSDAGRKRLHKLLAKMGVSLTQCKQSYTHMDMDLKRGLREKLLKYAPVYGLDGLVPPATGMRGGKEGWGFVRSWGWKACLSATDVAVIVGAILEVGKSGLKGQDDNNWDISQRREPIDADGTAENEEWVGRFFEAYDALSKIDALKHALPTAQHLHRSILRTGTSLLEKRQIRHLRAFRMAVVRDGPDVQLFTHPGALTKLALWVGEAIQEQEKEKKGPSRRGTPLVLAALNESRGVYVIVGTGSGGGVVDLVGKRERKERREAKKKAKEEKRAERERKLKGGNGEDEDDEGEETEDADSDDSDSDEESEERGYGRNRFGNAFQEVIEETNARTRIDSFETCVVEIRKEDLSGFLESLSMKAVVG
ncbi:MAG: hypothetical protein M1834_007126 [Cirrosporium novae-zelandiae]|nr:MAG: hypothetical protein M1834_007126 [Cirrosporium novae-zelandiae]